MLTCTGVQINVVRYLIYLIKFCPFMGQFVGQFFVSNNIILTKHKIYIRPIKTCCTLYVSY
jgi:Na+-transporting methylmalonyl-CoA/oxaloacetate decarboxylase gamma subunit